MLMATPTAAPAIFSDRRSSLIDARRRAGSRTLRSASQTALLRPSIPDLISTAAGNDPAR